MPKGKLVPKLGGHVLRNPKPAVSPLPKGSQSHVARVPRAKRTRQG